MPDLKLPELFRFPGTSESLESEAARKLGLESASFGVAVTAYGLGQLTGVVYSVPPGGTIEVDFKLKLQCVTSDSIKNIDNLIKSLLSGSSYQRYEEESKLEASGGIGLFWFWSGGASASYETTKKRLEGYGLSEDNQQKIVTSMMQLASSLQEFNYKGPVKNTFDFTVSGSLFAVVMDCQITTGQETKEVRMIAPTPIMSGSGASLPALKPLYQ